MFKTQPFSMEIIRPSAAHLIAFPYPRSDDAVTDRANADAELKKRLLLLDSNWAAKNGGIKEYVGTSGGLTSVAAGNGTTKHPTSTGYTELTTDIVLTMFRVWEASASTRLCKVVVEYNNKPVPLSDYSHLGDGNTATDLVIIIGNTSGKYDTTSSKWKVTIYGPVLGLGEMDLGGKPLPQTTTQSKLLGIEDPAFERTVKDGGPGSGSFMVIENVGRMYVANGAGGVNPEVLNYVGEDLEKLLFGDNWTAGSANELTYQSDSISICLCQIFFNGVFPALHTATAADQGKHFASLYIHYGCRLTELQNLQNVKADSGDSIQRSISVEWREVFKRVLKTAA